MLTVSEWIRINPAKTAPVARVGIGYADAVVLAGGMPVILPPYAKDVELDALLERLDGLGDMRVVAGCKCAAALIISSVGRYSRGLDVRQVASS